MAVARKITFGFGLMLGALVCVLLAGYLIDSEPDACKRAGMRGLFFTGPAGAVMGPVIYSKCVQMKEGRL